MGWLDFAVPDIGGVTSLIDDRAKTLDIVARWLVRDLVARTPERSAGQLTDAAFAVLHPELGGRKLAANERDLIADYKRIRREIVEPALGQSPATTSKYKRHKNGKGLSRYSIREGGARLEDALRDLRARRKLAIEDDDIDTFQRISNVETGGGVQALNTWDSAVVSIGFVQVTLQHGKLQELIRRAPDAFRRYGIELDESRTYSWTDRAGKTTKQVAIKNAPTRDELRWEPWADQFYRAGLDEEIVVAQVADAKVRLEKGIAVAKTELKGAFGLFEAAYDASLPMRGLYQEALNNLPRGAEAGIIAAAKQATDAAGYYDILKRTIPAAFAAWGKKRNDEAHYREKGQHIVDKTAVLHYKS